MARRRKPRDTGDWLLPKPMEDDDGRSSLVDVLNTVLNRGAVLNGDIVLGVANVDLIYVKLSVLLAAFDKATKRDPVFTAVPARAKKKRRR
jgi:hypothetical protein